LNIAIASLAQDLLFESFQALILVAVLNIVANFVIILSILHIF